MWRGDLRTGQGAVLVPGAPGRMAIGLDVRRGRIFVAGGPTGRAFVYDAETGAEIASHQLTSTSPPTFVNDVVVTRSGAYFTDSFKPFLYRIPIGPRRTLGATSEAIPLGGDITYQADFNVNGIDATPDGKTLVIVQSNTGLLFTVEPQAVPRPGSTWEAPRAVRGGAPRRGRGVALAGSQLRERRLSGAR